jgi:osmotically-inducible protein OsmY
MPFASDGSGETNMSTVQLTAADVLVRDSVMQQLEWDSEFDASAIGVAAVDGAVTLTGYIDTYAAKLAAERAAKRVRGVRAVANDVQVRLRLERTDTDIATDAAHALNLRANSPESVQATVHSGHITLTGTVSTLFQRSVAEKAIRHIKGLKGVVNRITVAPSAPSADVAAHIMGALHREADVNAHGIEVTSSGDTIVLKGTVRSWGEREAAERSAMHSHGISHVVNLLVVGQDDEVG